MKQDNNSEEKLLEFASLLSLDSLPQLPRRKTVKVSKQYFEELAKLPTTSDQLNLSGIPIEISHLFPVNLEDGSVCHGVIVTESEIILIIQSPST